MPADPVDFLRDALLRRPPADSANTNDCIKGEAANSSHTSLMPKLTLSIRISDVRSLIDEDSHVESSHSKDSDTQRGAEALARLFAKVASNAG